MQYVHCNASATLRDEVAGMADGIRELPVTPFSTFNANSIAKPFTAVAMLRLAQAGAVVLDDPVSKYLGNLIRNDRGATIRQTLCHAGGWPNPIPMSWIHLASEHEKFDSLGWRTDVLRRHAVGAEPGRKASYSNIGYLLVGELIERVSAQRFENFVEREVFDKIGLRHGEYLGFVAPDLPLHARGNIGFMSLLNALLGWFIERDRFIEGRNGRWSQFEPFYGNGAAYGGLIANAGGLARFLGAMLSVDCPVLDPAWRGIYLGLDSELPPLGWFRGVVDGEPYLAHAGGGGGYYGELRLYQRLGRGSAILFNRTGVKDLRVLDFVDRECLRQRAPPPATGT